MLKLALAYRKASPGSPASGEPDRAAHPFFDGVRVLRVGGFEGRVLGGHAAGLVEQMAHRDLCGAAVLQREPGQVGPHRLIQPQPAGLDLLHHGDGCEGLGGGGQQHRRLGGHRPPGVVGAAERGGVHLDPVFDDDDGGSRKSHGVKLFLQEGVHRFVGLFGGGLCGGRDSGGDRCRHAETENANSQEA